MSKRKPLPYSASQAIDQALMANSQAVRALIPLVRGESLSAEERMRRLAEAVHQVHESTLALMSIRVMEPAQGMVNPGITLR